MFHLAIFLLSAILFFVLTPGILVCLPPNAKGKYSKYIIAATHALIFAIISYFIHKVFWHLTERFYDPPHGTNSPAILNPDYILPTDNGTTTTFLNQNSPVDGTTTTFLNQNTPVDGTTTTFLNQNTPVDGTRIPFTTFLNQNTPVDGTTTTFPVISLNPADLLPSDNGTTATFLIQNSHLKSTITQNNSPVDGTLTEVQNDNSYYWVDGTIYPVITGYFNFTNDGTVPSIAGTNFDSNPIPYDHDGNPIYF